MLPCFMDKPWFNYGMTMISFQIPMNPLSLNQSHRLVKFGNRASRIKTNEFVQWEKEFNDWLLEYSDLKTHLNYNYDDRKHAVQLEMYIYLNEEKFFTKPKNKKDFRRISQKSGDVSNMIKTSEDQIFRWLGIDDSQNTSVHCHKIPTNGEPTMVFQISLIPIPELFLVQPSES